RGRGSARSRPKSASRCRIASIASSASSRRCGADRRPGHDGRLMLSDIAMRVRHAVYRTFTEGGIPQSAMLERQLHLKPGQIQPALEELHDAHAIVLDPRTHQVSMALPFSSVPTPHVVEGGGRSWFANCAWDAFGIPILVGV